MDQSVQTQVDEIRKIEDIIDLQKANGNLKSTKQVVFNLPTEKSSTVPISARSLESGLSEKKKNKKSRSKHHKSPSSDVISWPSDSDITVLRMKLCLTKNELKNEDLIPGDGLHQPDSSSMVNLATLMLQSRTPSKHSINVEEYLLPLSSWETHETEEKKVSVKEYSSKIDQKNYGASSSDGVVDETVRLKNEIDDMNAKSRVARFLRLYFCPCCTCLYKMEKFDQQSCYFPDDKFAHST